MIQNLKAVQFRSFLARDRSQSPVPCLRHPAGGNRCVYFCLFEKSVLSDIGLALAQGLGMTDHSPDLLHFRAGHRKQVMYDRKRIDTVYIEAPVEHQVHDLPDFAGITVLDRKNSIIALTFHNGQISVVKRVIGYAPAVREDPLGGNMGKGSHRSAKSHFCPADQTLLILFGNLHDILHKGQIIGFDHLIRDQGTVALQDLFFLRRIKDRKPSLLLEGGNIFYCRHSFLKKLRHLRVCFLNCFPRFFQISHSFLLPCFNAALYLHVRAWLGISPIRHADRFVNTSAPSELRIHSLSRHSPYTSA